MRTTSYYRSDSDDCRHVSNNFRPDSSMTTYTVVVTGRDTSRKCVTNPLRPTDVLTYSFRRVDGDGRGKHEVPHSKYSFVPQIPVQEQDRGFTPRWLAPDPGVSTVKEELNGQKDVAWRTREEGNPTEEMVLVDTQHMLIRRWSEIFRGSERTWTPACTEPKFIPWRRRGPQETHRSGLYSGRRALQGVGVKVMSSAIGVHRWISIWLILLYVTF